MTDGGHVRRRRRSSGGDSELVVLSVVFNKKKQKQNDEVSIAIERLRENGVNCVLFTMNDFRSGSSAKTDTVYPEDFDLTPSNPTSTKLNSSKYSLPLLPSIRCEVMENSNSNSSTDSSTSSNLAIHESVEKVINSFSDSPSSTPPPLSPQLHLHSDLESSEIPMISTMSTSFHELLSPLIPPASHPPTLIPHHSTSQITSTSQIVSSSTSSLKLQEIQICSSNSEEFNKNAKRRRRRVRKPYTHRKAQLKKKLKSLADEAKAARAARKSAQECQSEKPSSTTSDSTSKSSYKKMESSYDVMVTSVDKNVSKCLRRQQRRKCLSSGLKVEEFIVESNVISQEQISSSSDQVKPETEPKVLKEMGVTSEETGRFDATEDVTAIPDSSSASFTPRRGFSRRRRKCHNNTFHSKGGAHKPSKYKSNPGEVPTIEDNTFHHLVNKLSHRDSHDDKSNNAQTLPSTTTLLQFVKNDAIPVDSLLNERAFSPDIISGLKRFQSNKLGSNVHKVNVNPEDGSNALKNVNVSTYGNNNSQEVVEVKSSQVFATQNCVQSQRISKVNQVVQPTTQCSGIQPSPLGSKMKKRNVRGRRVCLVVRKNKRYRSGKSMFSDAATGESFRSNLLPSAIIKQSRRMSESEVDVFIKEETCLSQDDDDSVPSSVDSGLPSSETVSVVGDSKNEIGNESSGSSLDAQINAFKKKVVTSYSGETDPYIGLEVPCQGLDDSLPSTPDGMQLRRSTFYSLISDNVRRNMENYLDGRMLTKTLAKRRKRTKNSYLLNHGDNSPNDPEAPYRLHMATQVLLKLNKRRAKCKPKEDRGKSLLSYLKLAPKRIPRTGKSALPSSKDEEPTEKYEEPLFSGEWTITRKYICHVCGQIEMSFWDMVMHKGEVHPGVLVTHTELIGQVPYSLVRTTPTQTTTTTEEAIPPCSKCNATFGSTPDLHRHIFECAGNATWLAQEKTPRKRKTKRRRGFKRRLSNTPRKSKNPELPKRRPSEVFKCEFCPREFKTEGWLKNHLVTHSLPVSIPLEKLSLPSRASNNSTSSRLFKT